MAVWFTSDQHFGHERILELGSGRPFKNIGHHNVTIMNNWLNVVQPEDTVYVLGDIAMGSFEESVKLFAGLTGDKLFVAGNHDKIFSGNNSDARIEKFAPLYEQVGFSILPENTSVTLETSWGVQEVLLSHFPYSGDSHSEVDRYAQNRFKDEGLPIVHGHTHSREKLNPNNRREFHVGVDAHGFMPVHESEIVEWLEVLKQDGVI